MDWIPTRRELDAMDAKQERRLAENTKQVLLRELDAQLLVMAHMASGEERERRLKAIRDLRAENQKIEIKEATANDKTT